MKKTKLQTILSILCAFLLIVFLWVFAVYHNALNYALEPHKLDYNHPYTRGETATWITIDNVRYVPDYQNLEVFTPDKFIGFACDFFSSFKYQSTIPKHGVYTVLEDDNVLVVYSTYCTKTVFVPEEKDN